MFMISRQASSASTVSLRRRVTYGVSEQVKRLLLPPRGTASSATGGNLPAEDHIGKSLAGTSFVAWRAEESELPRSSVCEVIILARASDVFLLF